MDVHKPKPVHSWRELFNEVGVVVIGIAIALTGEQAVESLHWRDKVRQAERAMRAELVDDDGPQAYARLTIGRCLDDKLANMREVIESGADRAEVSGLAQAYDPLTRTWDRQAWDTALASDVAPHMGADRMTKWAYPYDIIPLMAATASDEIRALYDLQDGSSKPGSLSSAEKETLLRAVNRLAHINGRMRGEALVLLLSAKGVGAQPPADVETKILADARKRFGPCVDTPNLQMKVTNVSQFATTNDYADGAAYQSPKP